MSDTYKNHKYQSTNRQNVQDTYKNLEVASGAMEE